MESFRSVTRSYYRNAVGAVIVYDVTNRASFQNVKAWLDEARSNGGANVIVLLVGNKTDLEDQRKVSYEEGKSFALQYKLLFLETSALSGTNVSEAFLLLTRKVLSQLQGGHYDLSNDVTYRQKCGIKVAAAEASEDAKQERRECYYCK